MDYYDVKRLALVLSVQAEIEGMKSKNAQQARFKHLPTYAEEDFKSKAAELENLAHAHNEQL